LIELLVVIAIIATLVAMLMPAINSVRMSAKSATCLGRQKQLSTAVLRYSQEWRGYLPIYQGDEMWYAAVNNWQRLVNGNFQIPSDSSLWTMLFCTEDRNQSIRTGGAFANKSVDGTLARIMNEHFISIGMNYLFALDPNLYVWQGSAFVPRVGPPRLISFGSPAQTILLGDSMMALSANNALFSYGYGSCAIQSWDPTGACVYPRHFQGRSTNVTLLDGRAMTVKTPSPRNVVYYYGPPTAGGFGLGAYNDSAKPETMWWDAR
jgi:type II secretory pathway pseudopilin PulG